MKLAHAGDNRLAGIFVGENLKGGILFGKPLQGDAHFLLVLFRLRLDRHRDDRVREGRRLEQDREIFVTERVARGDILNPDDGGDVARIAGIDVLTLVGLNLNQPADALALVRARIVDVVALAQRTGINAKENQLADERITPEFESERAKLAVVIRRRLHFLVRVGLHSERGRNVERTREIIDDRVHQILHALVLKSGTTHDWDKFVGYRLATNSRLQHLRRDLLLFQNRFRDLIVEIGNLLD